MSKNNKTKSADELPKAEEDWNFTNIPQAELLLAEIYEFSREIKEVREAFSVWLDSEASITRTYFSGDYDSPQSFVQSQPGCSYRDLITVFNIQGGYEDYSWWEIIEEFDSKKIAGHRLWAIVRMLSDWPKPYKIARESESVKLAIARTLGELSERKRGQAVVLRDPRESKNNRMGQRTFSVDVDCSMPKRAIEEEFGRICGPFLSSRRGRKKKGTPNSIRLKQLAAYRLQNRFIGKGKKFPSFASFEIEISKRVSEFGAGKILPNYASQSGLAKACHLASLELKKYRYYTAQRACKTGKFLPAAPYPDQFTDYWDEGNEFFLKKLF